eukprot:1161686-Pelagomonas_calceolata.AAC.2
MGGAALGARCQPGRRLFLFIRVTHNPRTGPFTRNEEGTLLAHSSTMGLNALSFCAEKENLMSSLNELPVRKVENIVVLKHIALQKNFQRI